MDPIEMQERFESELYSAQIIFQILDECIFDEKIKYRIKHARPFFNTMYVLIVDSLCARIIRLFDPATQGRNGMHENFCVDRVEKVVGKSVIKDADKFAIKALRKYRDKHLSHADLKTSTEELPPHQEINNLISIAIDALHRVNDTILIHNGNTDTRGRCVVTRTTAQFNEIMTYGAFLIEHKDSDEYRSVLQEFHEWHREKEGY
ncbi:hypothetical protein [Pyruvatibacter mobilis]|uniref:hypothetical protein n=1 Tax=Pyruvatibacter mobilis TaxID=1712261 RepID=UPI003BAC07E4